MQRSLLLSASLLAAVLKTAPYLIASHVLEEHVCRYDRSSSSDSDVYWFFIQEKSFKSRYVTGSSGFITEVHVLTVL